MREVKKYDKLWENHINILEMNRQEDTMKTIGFIGMGNMAGAIAAGIIQKGLMKKEEVFAYAPHYDLSLIHISEPTRLRQLSRMPSSA